MIEEHSMDIREAAELLTAVKMDGFEVTGQFQSSRASDSVILNLRHSVSKEKVRLELLKQEHHLVLRCPVEPCTQDLDPKETQQVYLDALKANTDTELAGLVFDSSGQLYAEAALLGRYVSGSSLIFQAQSVIRVWAKGCRIMRQSKSGNL